MKKILFFAFLVSLIVPMVASAASSAPVECCKIGTRAIEAGETFSPGTCVGSGVSCDVTGCSSVVANEKWGLVCALNTLNVVINWAFLFFVILAVGLTVIGAFGLMFAAGEPAKVSIARNKIMFAAIGLLVALVARAIPSIVKAILGY